MSEDDTPTDLETALAEIERKNEIISDLRKESEFLLGKINAESERANTMTRHFNSRVDRENHILRFERKSALALAENTKRYITGKKFPEPDGVYGAEDRLNEILLLLRHRLETTPVE